jgi:hypothetical protein
MKRWTCIILPLAMISVASAFHKDQPPGTSYYLEQNQSTVSQQQSAQGTFAEVGSVPKDSEVERENKVEPNDFSAAKTLELNQERETAKQNLIQAEKEQEAKKSGKSMSWLWALVCGILGFGVIAYAMKWADKNLPEPPAPRKGKK